MSARIPGPWRVGRRVGRTIYDADDRLIGVMDTPQLAMLAAAAPTMLAALKACAAGPRPIGALAAVRALIARIEGP